MPKFSETVYPGKNAHEGVGSKQRKLDIKQNPSLVFSGDRKILTRGSTVQVGNEACRVSHWNGGPEGWDFHVDTENQ